MTVVYFNGSPIRMVRRLFTILYYCASVLLGTYGFADRYEYVTMDYDHPIVYRHLTFVRPTFGAVCALNVIR